MNVSQSESTLFEINCQIVNVAPPKDVKTYRASSSKVLLIPYLSFRLLKPQEKNLHHILNRGRAFPRDTVVVV
jgi:hypothetical protein